MLGLSGFLIIALLIGGYYKVEMAKKNTIIARVAIDKTCDLQLKNCSLKLPNGGEVTLAIEPRPIPLVKKFNINVTTNNVKAEAISVDFKGTTMNMGPNNVKLKSLQSDNLHFNKYAGQGMLPVCIRNSMEWQADVYVQTDEGIFVAPFIFVTHKH